MAALPLFGFGIVLFLALAGTGSALECWSCSSDLDITCMDHFNRTQILQQRLNYHNTNYQNQQYNQQYNNQQYNNQQNNQYNNNNNRNYNPNTNYNQGSFNNYDGNNRMPAIVPCGNNLGASIGQRQYCQKKIFTTSDGRKITYRGCQTVSSDIKAGTCPYEATGRGTTIDFCEYCEYDGCNAASGISTNVVLAVVIPAALLLFFRK